jgi:hypothetical protein
VSQVWGLGKPGRDSDPRAPVSGVLGTEASLAWSPSQLKPRPLLAPLRPFYLRAALEPSSGDRRSEMGSWLCPSLGCMTLG